MDVSFVIVSWNAKKYLDLCIKSILKTIGPHSQEITVVDNASIDGSAEMINDGYPSVRLIRNSENLGFAKANNIGIRASTGKYIALVNSDVEVLPECIDRMFKHMDDNPNIGLLGPQILDAKGNIQRSCMGFPSLWDTFCRTLALDSVFPKSRLFGGHLMTYWPHNTLRAVNIINGCFWLVRREAMNQVGMLDERFFIYAEDKDWCKRFWDAGWEVVFYPEAQSIHYGGGSSANAPIRFSVEMQRANMEYWKKHFSRQAQLAYLSLSVVHHLLRLSGQAILTLVRPSKKEASVFKVKRSIASIRWLLTDGIRKREDNAPIICADNPCEK